MPSETIAAERPASRVSNMSDTAEEQGMAGQLAQLSLGGKGVATANCGVQITTTAAGGHPPDGVDAGENGRTTDTPTTVENGEAGEKGLDTASAAAENGVEGEKAGEQFKGGEMPATTVPPLTTAVSEIPEAPKGAQPMVTTASLQHPHSAAVQPRMPGQPVPLATGVQPVNIQGAAHVQHVQVQGAAHVQAGVQPAQVQGIGPTQPVAPPVQGAAPVQPASQSVQGVGLVPHRVQPVPPVQPFPPVQPVQKMQPQGAAPNPHKLAAPPTVQLQGVTKPNPPTQGFTTPSWTPIQPKIPPRTRVSSQPTVVPPTVPPTIPLAGIQTVPVVHRARRASQPGLPQPQGHIHHAQPLQNGAPAAQHQHSQPLQNGAPAPHHQGPFQQAQPLKNGAPAAPHQQAHPLQNGAPHPVVPAPGPVPTAAPHQHAQPLQNGAPHPPPAAVVSQAMAVPPQVAPSAAVLHQSQGTIPTHSQGTIPAHSAVPAIPTTAPVPPVPISQPHHQPTTATTTEPVRNVIQVPQNWIQPQSRPSSQLQRSASVAATTYSYNNQAATPRKKTSYDDDYSYVPGNYIFLRDGTINPRYLSLFETGYFMFKRRDVPWLNEKLHIFGIPIDISATYIVYIPSLGYEQSVRGGAISHNLNEPDPHNPRTFMARVSGVNYICSRLRAAPHPGYNIDAHRSSLLGQHEVMNQQHLDTGSVVRYVPEPAPPDTFSIFGVPVYKSQTYYVYIPQFNNEYTVPGINVSPNPDDKSTLLVTINRGRYHATSIRPVFPELVYPDRPLHVSQNPAGQIVAYGIPIKPEETYSVFVPAMKKEYIVFGGKIALHDNDTVKVNVSGVELVGTSVRPSMVRNNHVHGDKGIPPACPAPEEGEEEEDSEEEEEGEGRYAMVAFGIPIHTEKRYSVQIPELGESVTLPGADLAVNPDKPNTILARVQETWHEGASVKEVSETKEDTPASDSGPTYPLAGLITAFGIPILPSEKYKVFIPSLGTECVVYGRNISRNPADPGTVVVIISGLQFTGESLREAREPLCPKYPVGTILSSSDRRYRALREEEVSGSDSSGDERRRAVDLDLKIKRDTTGTPPIPELIVNSTAIYREKWYSVTLAEGATHIVRGSDFEPLLEGGHCYNVMIDGQPNFLDPQFPVRRIAEGPSGPKCLSRESSASAFGEYVKSE